MRRGSCLLVALCAAHMAAAGPAPAWLRLDTRNFTLIGSVGERELGDVAAQFERFREALAQILHAQATATIVPTVVIVFDSDRAFDPFKPVYRGRPVRLGGMFVGSSEINYIVLRSGRRDHRPIFHEYAHLMITNVTPDLPPWLNEGLAEYYSTFELEGGRHAILGRPVDPHLLMLRDARLMPLPELVSVRQESPLYNEGERRSVFYAQSWALVHYLLRGKPERADLVAEYANAVEAGATASEAWDRVFGREPIAGGLKNYILGSEFSMARLTLGERIETAAAVARPLSEGNVEAFLGDLLYRLRRPDQAAARLEPAAERPDGARARTALARVRAHQKRRADAWSLLARPEVAPGDWLADYAYGVAAGEAFSLERPGPDAAAATAFARESLRRALAAQPDVAHGWYVLAGLALVADADLDTALTAIVRARAIAPSRLEYPIRHADVLIRQRDYVGAREVLGALLAKPGAAGIREAIDTKLKFLATAERAAAAAPDVEAPDTNRVVVLNLREPQPGEERAAGMLTQVDCERDGLTLHVRIRGETSQFHAGHFQDVQFVTYRDELRGNIACGPREPEDLVYITWRGVSPDRTAVAVEFLPKGYRLKPTPRSRRRSARRPLLCRPAARRRSSPSPRRDRD